MLLGVMLAAAVAAAVLFALHSAAFRHRSGKANKAAMPGPRATSLLGHMRDVMQPGVHRQLTAWANAYGGLYQVRGLQQ